MSYRLIFVLLFFLLPLSASAEDHKDLALQYVMLTDLESTFKITRDAVINNLNDYKNKLKATKGVKGNREAEKLTDDFIDEAKRYASVSYGWNGVEKYFVNAILKTYSAEELKHINEFLETDYGKVFIKKQHIFMNEMISINAMAGEQFKYLIANPEKEYIKAIEELRKK